MDYADQIKLYQDFLKRYPLERLDAMPLSEYTNLVPNESFCNTVEAKTHGLGSIWGANSYKFGIYRCKGTVNSGKKYKSDGKYAWLGKLGDTAAEAYNNVLNAIVTVANAARMHDLEAVDKVDVIGPMFKWKVAFLYSDMWIVPIYSRDWLVEICSHLGMAMTKETSIADMQSFLISHRGEAGVFQQTDALLAIHNDLNKKAIRRRYWLAISNPEVFSFSDKPVGHREAWSIYNDNGHKRMVFADFENAKLDDIVVCYDSYPAKRITAIGRISKPCDGQEIEVEKVEHLPDSVTWDELKNASALSEVRYIKSPRGVTFCALAKQEAEAVLDMIRKKAQNKPEIPFDLNADPYGKEDFLREVFMTDEKFEHLAALVNEKLNVILQGAPGVGKTFSAKRLAYAIMGERDDDRIEMVQFHQNYSYEDFIMGLRPTEDGGFKMQSGCFYDFCTKAENDPDKAYFFIIDEINRGNLGKIFGELLMLIENSYRGHKIRLAYRDELFAVPKNIRIIGMMNTADRSIALIDYALRRRFSFFDMAPGFDTDGFKAMLKDIGNDDLNRLVAAIAKVNNIIASDPTLGKGFCIGHSYFCVSDPKALDNVKLRMIVNYDIAPMLREYWFDDDEKYKEAMELINDNLS